jgi:hypothetical protein
MMMCLSNSLDDSTRMCLSNSRDVDVSNSTLQNVNFGSASRETHSERCCSAFQNLRLGRHTVNSQDDVSMPMSPAMCISKSQDDRNHSSMPMCLSDSHDERNHSSMPMCRLQTPKSMIIRRSEISGTGRLSNSDSNSHDDRNHSSMPMCRLSNSDSNSQDDDST